MDLSYEYAPNPMDENQFFLHFTGPDEIRDMKAIGECGHTPMLFEFDTNSMHYQPGNVTEIIMNRMPVATLNWHTRDRLGLVNITLEPRIQATMSNMAIHVPETNGRMFTSADGVCYEWRRSPEDPRAYDLFLMPDALLGKFRHEYEDTPVGPSFAYLQFCFDHQRLLLESMLSLCINRWLDQ
ncbi:hypothetical protein FIBSPDRAFT_528926 [Athelia psychrophila]|uniref:Uncharacterized protein n=1 Tax=Athelia psychrophila TaxID=1759441 RepID=A0A166JEH8_9AGAM|nr:hypothetical protein FIBSPDRAFT_528926 [Fibularhizoctonia sp. CBS 109695]